MENVALRLDLGFLSLVSESPVKIFGNEIAREIHDMNCELVETALRLQKKIAEDSKFKLTRADREKLLSRYLRPILLCRRTNVASKKSIRKTCGRFSEHP